MTGAQYDQKWKIMRNQKLMGGNSCRYVADFLHFARSLWAKIKASLNTCASASRSAMPLPMPAVPPMTTARRPATCDAMQMCVWAGEKRIVSCRKNIFKCTIEKIISSTGEDAKGESAKGWRIEEAARNEDEMAEDEQKRKGLGIRKEMKAHIGKQILSANSGDRHFRVEVPGDREEGDERRQNRAF